MMWLTAIANMENKLGEMFKNLTARRNDPNSSLGTKYIHAGVNIWGGQHKPNVEGVESKRVDLGSLGELFHEEAQKMEFYKHIKHANHTKEDEIGQEKWQISKASLFGSIPKTLAPLSFRITNSPPVPQPTTKIFLLEKS